MLFADVDVDELVRNYCHFLKRKCLDFCSWEALNDPTELLLFVAFDFSFHKVDNDVVVNYLNSKGLN